MTGSVASPFGRKTFGCIGDGPGPRISVRYVASSFMAGVSGLGFREKFCVIATDDRFPARLIEPIAESRARLVTVGAVLLEQRLTAAMRDGVFRQRGQDLVPR